MVLEIRLMLEPILQLQTITIGTVVCFSANVPEWNRQSLMNYLLLIFILMFGVSVCVIRLTMMAARVDYVALARWKEKNKISVKGNERNWYARHGVSFVVSLYLSSLTSTDIFHCLFSTVYIHSPWTWPFHLVNPSFRNTSDLLKQFEISLVSFLSPINGTAGPNRQAD